MSTAENMGYPRSTDCNVHLNDYGSFTNAGRVQFSLAP